jgi:hypothetical protein
MAELGLSFGGGDGLQLIGGPTYEIDFDRHMILRGPAIDLLFHDDVPARNPMIPETKF